MSHFTVLVIGNDPEKQLEPFSEHLEVPEYQTEVVSDMEILRFLNYYRTFNPEDKRSKVTEEIAEKNKTLTFEQLYEEFGNDWNNGSWKVLPDGKLGEFSTYNPKSKWDWYQLGGRWNGFLKVKKGKRGVKGSPGVFGNSSTKRGYCDQALKKDIDFIGMKVDAGKEAQKQYKEIAAIFGGTIPKLEYTWEQIRTGAEHIGKSIEEKRMIYHNQPSVKEAAKHLDKLGYMFSLEPFQVSMEEYVEGRQRECLDTYAVLMNGEWYEKGEMGWFGMSLNENPDWSNEFQKLLDSIDDETLISLYDCHI